MTQTQAEQEFVNQPAQGGSAPATSSPLVSPPAGMPVQGSYYRDDSRRKSPALATMMSMMPGLGQVYVGYYQQGFINILVVGSLIALLNTGVGDLDALVGIFLAFFWLYNLVDAGRRAVFYNQAVAGLGALEIPKDAPMPDHRGSLVGGILLIAFGALFFAHTQFDISLEWVQDWWPLALVLMGAYLIYRWWAERPLEEESAPEA
jgi:hypothetical protein